MRMSEPRLMKFAQVRQLGTSFRCEGWEDKFESSSFQRNQNWNIDSGVDNPFPYSSHRRSKSSESRDDLSRSYRSVRKSPSGSVMQTLDRRISASSDNLDTLRPMESRKKPVRAHSSTRISFERKFNVEQRPKVDQLYTQIPFKNERRSRPKTPFEIFLEDDGPYSRQLYTSFSQHSPCSPKHSKNQQREFSGAKTQEVTASQTPLRKERIVYTSTVGSRVSHIFRWYSWYITHQVEKTFQ